jgi:hypothetical protein
MNSCIATTDGWESEVSAGCCDPIEEDTRWSVPRHCGVERYVGDVCENLVDGVLPTPGPQTDGGCVTGHPSRSTSPVVLAAIAFFAVRRRSRGR